MTQAQATAEVFWTAFQALTPAERAAFLSKLMKNKKLAEDLRYATIIESRKDEATISLDSYLARRAKSR